MTTDADTQDAGHARYTYRLRVSSTAFAKLRGEWDRCRWIWNESVAKSRAKAHKDIKERVPLRRRAGMPKFKKKRDARPSLNYARRGFRVKDGKLHAAAASSCRWCGRGIFPPRRPACACTKTVSGIGTPRSS